MQEDLARRTPWAMVGHHIWTNLLGEGRCSSVHGSACKQWRVEFWGFLRLQTLRHSDWKWSAWNPMKLDLAKRADEGTSTLKSFVGGELSSLVTRPIMTARTRCPTVLNAHGCIRCVIKKHSGISEIQIYKILCHSGLMVHPAVFNNPSCGGQDSLALLHMSVGRSNFRPYVGETSLPKAIGCVSERFHTWECSSFLRMCFPE